MDKEKRKSKKAVSTIEMIVSFTIFLAFIIFLMAYLNPVKSTDISGALLDSAENGIENATETDLIEMPVVLDTPKIRGECFNIENPFTKGNETNVFIKDSGGNFISFNRTGENFTIQGTGDRIYYLYFSDDESVTNIPPQCAKTTPVLYKFSVPRLKKVYSYTLLKSFNGAYADDASYLALKRQFNLPITYNFGLKVYNSTDTIIEIMKQKPEKVIVNAREIPIQIMKDREIQYVHMSIQVW